MNMGEFREYLKNNPPHLEKTKTMNYTIGEVLFDAEENLHFCKMGIKTRKEIELHYTVWAKTALDCKERAESLAEILTAHLTTKTV